MGTNNIPQGISVNLWSLVAKIIRAQHLWSKDSLWTSAILSPLFIHSQALRVHHATVLQE